MTKPDMEVEHKWTEKRGSESRKEIWYKVEKAQEEIDSLRAALADKTAELELSYKALRISEYISDERKKALAATEGEK